MSCEQLFLDRPFGVECVRASIDFRPGEGWVWKVGEWLDGRSHVWDSGVARSSQSALDAVASCLATLAGASDAGGF